jgi:hypothetical protein
MRIFPSADADGASDAGCPSALALPVLYPARISISSALLAATMNQKSSFREDPKFVSWVLTGNSHHRAQIADVRRDVVNLTGPSLFGVVSGPP